jgi:hypothetical protein
MWAERQMRTRLLQRPSAPAQAQPHLAPAAVSLPGPQDNQICTLKGSLEHFKFLQVIRVAVAALAGRGMQSSGTSAHVRAALAATLSCAGTSTMRSTPLR